METAGSLGTAGGLPSTWPPRAHHEVGVSTASPFIHKACNRAQPNPSLAQHPLPLGKARIRASFPLASVPPGRGTARRLRGSSSWRRRRRGGTPGTLRHGTCPTLPARIWLQGAAPEGPGSAWAWGKKPKSAHPGAGTAAPQLPIRRKVSTKLNKHQGKLRLGVLFLSLFFFFSSSIP